MKNHKNQILLPLAAVLLLSACEQPTAEITEVALPDISAEAIKGHISTLADDNMMGREAGSEGYNSAADYVAGQMKALGLKPGAADGTYFQPVPLRGYHAIEEGSKMILHRNGIDEELTIKVDYMPGADPELKTAEASAALVFAGYGLEAPEKNYNDYEGLDVEGKIVVILSGAPDIFQSEERAYYGSSKAETAARHGAVGIITVATNASDKRFTFERAARSFGRERMTWVGPDGKGHIREEGIKVSASVSPAIAARLFEGAPKSYEDIRTDADTAAPEGFNLTGSVTIIQQSAHRDVQSKNVIGMIHGSDARLAKEYVVLSAHLDHLGVKHGGEEGEDKINNGALDNAAGVATMLEVAHAFKDALVKPKRSIIFLAVTAEEKGLVGADYFAYNPTVAKKALVADVNLDMPLILYDFADVIAFGADRSTLGPLVASAAERMGLALSPDPLPEQSLFVRSDHYRFVQQGIPSLFLVTGFNAVDGEGKGGEIFKDFLENHYHSPSDDLDLPIDFEAGAKFAKINYLIAQNIANAANSPAWNEGDFFGNKYSQN